MRRPNTRPTLLFVDDEQANLNLFKNLFKRDYQVETCQEGGAALGLLSQQTVAVLVCDQRMPGLSGTEILTRAREISPATVRVLVTAYPDIDVAIEAINQGRVRRYLEKPWEPSELRAIIEQCVEIFELNRRNRELVEALRERNLTLEEQSAELAQRNAELNRLDRVKTELLTNVSHELRTPLVSIRGYADLMRSGRMGDVTEPQHRALRVIQGSVKRLVGLIEDLLDLSRLERGEEKLVREPLELDAVLEELVEALRARADEARIALTLQLDDGPLVVSGERRRLEQVFTNLLDNAIKFNHRGGEVSVHAHPTADGGVQVAVQDTGEGIPEAHLDRIFERFHQVDASSTRRHGGTGIGLSLVQRITWDHGGTIQVTSTQGEGSTFTVTLPPSAQDPPTAAARQVEDQGSPITARVLIVDDDLELLEYTAELLACENIASVTASQADEALRLVGSTEDIGLVLLDIAMPVTDGFALCRELRTTPLGRTVPIYMVSARVDADTVTRSLRAGADGHLVKPFDMEEFLSLVRRVLRQ